MTIWKKIKEFFGFFESKLDYNNDGKVTTDYVKAALDDVEKEAKRRVQRVKEELADVKYAAAAVAEQAGDVVDAAKGKPRRGRPKKTSTAAKKKTPAKKKTS